MNFELGKKYFKSFNLFLPIVMFIFGTAFIQGGLQGIFVSQSNGNSPATLTKLTNTTPLIVLGLILIVGGILIIVFKAKRRITDKQYEEAIASHPENLFSKAKQHLMLPDTESLIAPIMQFEDYKYHNVRESKHSNGRVRTDLYEKTAILLSERYLYCYSYKFRTTRQEEVINSEMLAYQDIISISLTQKNDTLRREPICIKHLEITTIAGKIIKIPYRYDEPAQRDVNIIRQVMREKKSAAETV